MADPVAGEPIARQAERRRDAINAKQQRIDHLQKAIDSFDQTVQAIRSRGSGASFFYEAKERAASPEVGTATVAIDGEQAEIA